MTTTNVSRLARAADHIDAVDLSDGRWAHYAAETSAWYVVSSEELAELCDYLDHDDEQISTSAYSHWCAGTSAEEMPEGWTPESDSAAAISATDLAVEIIRVSTLSALTREARRDELGTLVDVHRSVLRARLGTWDATLEERAAELLAIAVEDALDDEATSASLIEYLSGIGKVASMPAAQNNYEATAPMAREITAAMASRVGDDGTGDLRVIVDAAITAGASLEVDDLADVVREAREDAAALLAVEAAVDDETDREVSPEAHVWRER